MMVHGMLCLQNMLEIWLVNYCNQSAIWQEFTKAHHNMLRNAFLKKDAQDQAPIIFVLRRSLEHISDGLEGAWSMSVMASWGPERAWDGAKDLERRYETYRAKK